MTCCYFFSFSISLKRTVLTKDSSNANNNPHQKFLMLNPSTRRLANNTTSVFTTKRNKPRVTIVKGSVSIIKIGFTNTFNTANINANTSAVQKVSTCIPFNTLAKPKATRAVMKMRNKKFMWQVMSGE